eukprot:COSAG06_NODE_31195_length_525_cov_1.206573_1_plen_134_part_00
MACTEGNPTRARAEPTALNRARAAYFLSSMHDVIVAFADRLLTNAACVVVPVNTWQCISSACHIITEQPFVLTQALSQDDKPVKPFVKSVPFRCFSPPMVMFAWQSQAIPAGAGVGGEGGGGGGGGGAGGKRV